MVKKSIYPKTRRYSSSSVIITEKLDGSNLGFFKIDNELIIAQRNNIFKYGETDIQMYKGLQSWLDINAVDLLESLHEESGIFGEWISTGRIKYNNTDIDKKFYMFAKANLNKEYEVRNILYNQEFFIYPFVDQTIPEFIGTVPIVSIGNIVGIDDLDKMYDEYSILVDRNVEGFVINNNNNINKYVRMKDGKLGPHKSKR